MEAITGPLWTIFQIVGSLAFFIYGMKMMSDGIQRAAGSQLKNILRTMTKNRYLGVLTGFVITALVQSSSATTVMTVSFVNAGLISLVESAGVMMGANIGTTVTGWIVSLIGFKLKLGDYSIALFALAIPIYMASKGKLKYWGEFLIGFGILFMGLTLLKDSVPNLNESETLKTWINNLGDYGFFSRIIFVIIGTSITVIIQSSSAAMTLTLALVANGLPLEIAASIVLGENIGTTITAELASLVGNTSAKRSARIHSIFNLIGVTWMVILLPYALDFVKYIMGNANADTTLAAFHTFFNLTNVILLLAFVPWLVKVSIWSVPGNEEDDDDEFNLKYIGNRNLLPELATVELQKEAVHFGEVAHRMNKYLGKLMNATENKKRNKMHKKLSKYEEITDRMELEIAEYITDLASSTIAPKTSVLLRSVMNISNDLERIGDLYYQISKTIELKNAENTYFLPKQRQNLNEFCEKIDRAFKVMIINLSTESYSNVNKDAAVELEREINDFRKELRKEHLNNMGSPDYNIKSAMIYNTVFNDLEKIGDHIINVSESVVGEI